MGASPTTTVANINSGLCYVLFAYDIGLAIDLDQAERLTAAMAHREQIRHKRRAPASFQYSPSPLRVTQPAEPLTFASFRTAATVDCVLFDFGAVSVNYTIPLAGPLDGLLSLSEALYDNAALLADSRRRVELLLATIRPAVAKPCVTELVEDYAIFQVFSLSSPATPQQLLAERPGKLAQILRSERAALSAQETADALTCGISYGADDLTLIDWNAALLFDPEADDVRTVLEFANVELLEMRFLDRQLDRVLDASYKTLSRRWGRWLFDRSRGTDMRRVARLQADAAVLFEGVNNALKLVGDQYLARVYRLTSQRLHLPEWDATILRKLQTIESIYGKLTDEVASRRMELLEWIIIALIAISIVLPFLPGGRGH